MGNHVRADVTIGGRLNTCCVPALLLTLDGLFVRGLGVGDSDLDLPADATELEDLLLLAGADDRKEGVAPRGLQFGSDEVNYADLDDVLYFCRARGLAYHYDAADGGGDFDAEDVWWTPAGRGANLFSLINAGLAVPLAQLREGWKDKTGAEIAAWYDARMVEPGPLELVAVAGACPGCVAEALQTGSTVPEDYPRPEAPGAPEAA